MGFIRNERDVLNGKRILITGGTGSFGSTMAKSLCSKEAKEVRILSRDELKQHEMRIGMNGQPVSFYLGDVRDERSLDVAMAGVDYVFHAAALKQVPSCEFFPEEAVKTNVLGSANVLNSALRHGVKSVVLLSTDKAVFPVNAMGMTKSLMEKLGTAFARSNPTGPVVSTVRYGNVMMSRGSVIPLFIDQFRSGIPFTLTNPDMTRFLMPLIDAVDLVTHALASAEPGDLFVQKAPASTVRDLASAVAMALGEPDYPCSIMGTRHSEKLFETLASAEELARSEDQGRYFRVRSDMRGLDYEKYFDEGNPELQLDDYTSHSTTRLTVDGVAALLNENAEFTKLVAQT
jgi:UDP-N-acetylglucosamine 4,6-dehydratase/5-epimerase